MKLDFSNSSNIQDIVTQVNSSLPSSISETVQTNAASLISEVNSKLEEIVQNTSKTINTTITELVQLTESTNNSLTGVDAVDLNDSNVVINDVISSIETNASSISVGTIQLDEITTNFRTYPPVAPISIGNDDTEETFIGTVSGQTYGNGTYTITHLIDKGNANIPSLKSIDLLFDKQIDSGIYIYNPVYEYIQDSNDEYVLAEEHDAYFKFEFPEFITIKKMVTFNNNSCRSW